MSARSLQSPYTQTPWSGTFSPRSSIAASSAHPSSALTHENLRERDRNIDHTSTREKSINTNAKPDDEKKGTVCVRQTVTRTVMYSRAPKSRTTPLDPAPKGKRRRVEGPEKGDGVATKSETEEAKSEGSTE